MPAESFRRTAERVLSAKVFRDLGIVSEVAGRTGDRVLLVGGAVRDALLGRPTRDLDLVFVGPMAAGEKLVSRLATALSGELAPRSELPTWRVRLPGGRRLDLAMARREAYAAPGALPTVEVSGLDDDLARRDFTINALAVELGAEWGEVIDRHGGRPDLANGRLRVLHPGSFRDDPTRVLRGIELAVRLGFELEPQTAELARAALAGGALDGLSSARWQTAWRRAFGRLLASGQAPLIAGLRLAEDVGLLAALHPRLVVDGGLLERAARLADRAGSTRFRSARPDRLLARTLAWSDAAAAAALAERWAQSPAARDDWSSFGGRFDVVRGELGDAAGVPPSVLDRSLARFAAEELRLLELEPALEGPIGRYLDVVLPFRLAIGGRDLERHGYRPGPTFGEALARTRQARLDGAIGVSEELEYACRLLEAMER